MNKKLENKLTMYEGLLTLLQANSAKTQSVGGFADAVNEFVAVIDGLKTKSIEVDGAAVGKTSVKHGAEDELVAALLPVCSALFVFGRKQGVYEIKERINTTEAKLRAMRDTEFASFGNAAADMAAENAKGIEPFGITAEKIADLKTKAQAYSAAIGERESSVADRKGARGSMHELFDRADDLLSEELDRFIEMLRPVETELYNKYFAARVIKDTGIRHRVNGAVQEQAAPEAVKV